MELERVDEAFEAFQHAYSRRENFGAQKQGYLEILFNTWSTAALILGLSGSLEQDAKLFQIGVEQYLEILDKARTENLESAVLNLTLQEPATPELRAALEETQLAIRLMSIKDPFEGWRELGKEISKVWPKGLSAVKAVREIRR